MSMLAERFAPLAHYTSQQLARTQEDLGYIIQFVEASLLTGDDTIVTGTAHWLTSILTARGLPDGIVALGADVLRDCMPKGQTRASQLLTVMKTYSQRGK